jgi:PIN domain nuclease of toxin-antitoxin system
MKLLLDTHSFIWFFTGSPKLSTVARLLIEDESNEKLLSIASVWEMAIKQSLGKLYLGLPLQDYIEQKLTQNLISLLNLNLVYLDVIVTLPLHHRDSFDRLLIAQALVEKIPILSADSAFDAYPIQRLW